MKSIAAVVLAIACAGCVTADTIGSRPWHEERIAEIDAAYDDYEIDEDEYLELKNEADEIRSDYLDRLEERRSRYRYHVGIGYGYHGHYYHHPHFGHRPHW